MKLKEKINKELESHEAFVIMKKMWQNKRYRSIFWLILYFIFFSIIVTSLRNNYSNQTNNPAPTNPTTNVSLNVSKSLEKLDDYSYEIILNDNQSLIVGQLKDNTNTFVYNNKNYIIVGDNIYLENKSTLTKVDLTKNSDILIPINKITLDEIEEYIKNLEFIENEDSVVYNLSLSNIFENEAVGFSITFYGKEEIEIIELNFNDYVKSKELKYDQYILTIKIGGEDNERNA